MMKLCVSVSRKEEQGSKAAHEHRVQLQDVESNNTAPLIRAKTEHMNIRHECKHKAANKDKIGTLRRSMKIRQHMHVISCKIWSNKCWPTKRTRRF